MLLFFDHYRCQSRKEMRSKRSTTIIRHQLITIAIVIGGGGGGRGVPLVVIIGQLSEVVEEEEEEDEDHLIVIRGYCRCQMRKRWKTMLLKDVSILVAVGNIPLRY